MCACLPAPPQDFPDFAEEFKGERQRSSSTRTLVPADGCLLSCSAAPLRHGTVWRGHHCARRRCPLPPAAEFGALPGAKGFWRFVSGPACLTRPAWRQARHTCATPPRVPPPLNRACPPPPAGPCAPAEPHSGLWAQGRERDARAADGHLWALGLRLKNASKHARARWRGAPPGSRRSGVLAATRRSHGALLGGQERMQPANLLCTVHFTAAPLCVAGSAHLVSVPILLSDPHAVTVAGVLVASWYQGAHEEMRTEPHARLSCRCRQSRTARHFPPQPTTLHPADSLQAP